MKKIVKSIKEYKNDNIHTQCNNVYATNTVLHVKYEKNNVGADDPVRPQPNRNTQNGITLVALVITIIVLLLLAVVSINIVQNSGLIEKAKIAIDKHNKEAKKEQYVIDSEKESIEEVESGIKVEKVTDEFPGILEGKGTEEEPFTINSIEDFIAFADEVKKGNDYNGKMVMLGLSLDFNSVKSYVDPYRTDYEQYGYKGELKQALTIGEGFKPITSSFKGTFDGKNNKIINLYINTEKNNIALFINNYGIIKNLGIEKGYIRAETYASSLVLENKKEGIIENCNSSANVLGIAGLGGIVGNNLGTIDSCYNEGKVETRKAGWIYGGIAYKNSGIIKNCSNKGRIVGSYESGGIVGANSGTISNCSNSQNLELNKISGYEKGGIAGINGGKIECCYNSGVIYASGTASAGIVGRNAGTISSCYNTGNIQVNSGSTYYAGGICGENTGNISYVFNTGTVNGNKNKWKYGGICGKNQSSIRYGYNIGDVLPHEVETTKAIAVNDGEKSKVEKCFYLKGLPEDPNGIEKTEEEMKSIEYLNLLNEEEKNWKIDINNGYPILNWQDEE